MLACSRGQFSDTLRCRCSATSDRLRRPSSTPCLPFFTVFVTLPLLCHNSRAKLVRFSSLAFTTAAHRYSIYSTDRTYLFPSALTLPVPMRSLQQNLSDCPLFPQKKMQRTPASPAFFNLPELPRALPAFSRQEARLPLSGLTSTFVADSSSRARPQSSCHALE